MKPCRVFAITIAFITSTCFSSISYGGIKNTNCNINIAKLEDHQQADDDLYRAVGEFFTDKFKVPRIDAMNNLAVPYEAFLKKRNYYKLIHAHAYKNPYNQVYVLLGDDNCILAVALSNSSPHGIFYHKNGVKFDEIHKSKNLEPRGKFQEIFNKFEGFDFSSWKLFEI